MSDVVLSAGVRSNLLQLQSTADLIGQTQTRLATGKKVNSALDNPTNFFTASTLNARASDLGNLLDSMGNAIKTIEAADNALKAITNTVETLQSTARQARQDNSFNARSVALGTTDGTLTFSGGDLAATESIAVTASADATAGTAAFDFGGAITFNEADEGFSIDINVDGGGAETITITQADVATVGNNDNSLDSGAELAALLTAGIAGNANLDGNVTVAESGGTITLTSATDGASSSVVVNNFQAVDGSTPGANASVTAANVGVDSVTATAGADAVVGTDVDTLVTAINNNANLSAAGISAANKDGEVEITFESTSETDLTIGGLNTAGDTIGGSSSQTVEGNETRRNLENQFNELRTQLNSLADDAFFNGINLLDGDQLEVTFNEQNTSSLTIQSENTSGVNTTTLGITQVEAGEFASNATLDARLESLQDSLGTLRSQASEFGSNLSVVENRQDFTKATINTLESGADNLTLADLNEEGANLLALQTRQQLSTTALSLAAQADQNVLRLF